MAKHTQYQLRISKLEIKCLEEDMFNTDYTWGSSWDKTQFQVAITWVSLLCFMSAFMSALRQFGEVGEET